MVSPRRSSRARSTTHQIATSASSSASSSRNRHSRHRTEEDSHAELDANFQRGTDPDLHEADESHAADDSVIEETMDDVGDTEDEITRCVCGHQEYQGGDDDQTESDGLFIQCDLCKVWQHGFCVGITNETTPDNYYCEICKPELHREGLNKSGLKTSIYLPAQEEPTPSKPSAKETNQKRRTTMNSRDAEYDDEVLKRMLEVSKLEAKANAESNRGSRGRKRGTSEGSDEPKDSKRSRTTDSPDSHSNAIADSSDEKPTKVVANASSSRKARGTTTRQTSSNATSTKRTSARNRAAEKVEIRKEESEHSDDYAPQKNKRSTQRHAVEEPADPPATTVEPTVPDTPQQTSKRAARNGNNTGRRRNGRQTRHSEDLHDMGTPMSRVESSTGHGKSDHTASVLEKPTKPRLPAARITMNEMKKRVNSISEYITRTQVEMANTRQSDIYAYIAWMEEKGTPVSKSSTATPKSASPALGNSSSSSDIPRIEINGNRGAGTDIALNKASAALSGNMSALEIMEMLSTKINRWQQHFGEMM